MGYAQPPSWLHLVYQFEAVKSGVSGEEKVELQRGVGERREKKEWSSSTQFSSAQLATARRSAGKSADANSDEELM